MLLSAAVARLEGEWNGKSETGDREFSVRYNELQINSEHLHFCRQDEGAREDRKSQGGARRLFRFSLSLGTSFAIAKLDVV